MKKFVLGMLAVLMLLITSLPALADAELDWNRSCRSKTSQAVTIYEPEGDYANRVWHAVGTLPANTYVKVHMRDSLEGHIKISYYAIFHRFYSFNVHKKSVRMYDIFRSIALVR